MKYLYITEDGEFYQGNEPTDDDKRACDDGYLSVIDTENMTDYYRGKWEKIAEWEGEN